MQPRILIVDDEPNIVLALELLMKREGYEIRSVDCTSAYRHFGCLHCLVNVLDRR